MAMPVSADLLPAHFPAVWTTYRVVKSLDEDFSDLVRHHVRGADVGGITEGLSDVLAAARKHGIKLGGRLPSVIETAGTIDPDKVERAVMIAGACQGKAIDRFRFALDASPQKLTIERPVYHAENVYETYGHYFPHLAEPLRAEAVVKTAEFDGKAHVQRIPAAIDRIDQDHWQMTFDLTGVEGDLEHVMLAVYWETNQRQGMFRDTATPFSAETQSALAQSVRDYLQLWREANGGELPLDVLVAIRFGDEMWHTASHIRTSEAVSYPLWDYSASATDAFRESFPSHEVPIGKNWIDAFGRRAYADWQAFEHRANASTVELVKATMRDEGAGDIQLYRNITRANVYSEMNDHDGTGLEALVREFDVAHLDPYPVHASGYTEETIPIDMAYVAGLARRFDKPLMPWIQAHAYYSSGYFGLTHPKPAEIDRMLAQHKPFRPDAIMWLGYGQGEFNTFPTMRPESWDRAGEGHAAFLQDRGRPVEARLAVVRPYTVRALRDIDRRFPQDAFFTDCLLRNIVMERGWPYDPFEPIDTTDLDPTELTAYPFILAELGSLREDAIAPFAQSGRPCILFVEGADKVSLSPKETGIRTLMSSRGDGSEADTRDGTRFPVESADLYDVASDCETLASIDDAAVVWRQGSLLFVALRVPVENRDFPPWLWDRIDELASV